MEEKFKVSEKVWLKKENRIAEITSIQVDTQTLNRKYEIDNSGEYVSGDEISRFTTLSINEINKTNNTIPEPSFETWCIICGKGTVNIQDRVCEDCKNTINWLKTSRNYLNEIIRRDINEK